MDVGCVIKELEESIAFSRDRLTGDMFDKWLRASVDALALLKAQEPVEPKMMEFVDEGVTWEKYEVATCGKCGALLGDALYCPMCGQAVKWG